MRLYQTGALLTGAGSDLARTPACWFMGGERDGPAEMAGWRG